MWTVNDTLVENPVANYWAQPSPVQHSGRYVRSLETSKVSVVGAKAPHPDEKFGQVSEKPEGWVGPWHDAERNPPKLIDEDRDKLAKQGRCWSCRGSGHRGNDPCCPNAGRRAGARVSKAGGRKAEESGSESSSDSGKE